MPADVIVWMREWASDPRALVWIIKGCAIVPEDVLARPDDVDLLEFVQARIAGNASI